MSRRLSHKSARPKRLTVVDVFSGAGGLSTGFSSAVGPSGERYEVVYAVDHDKQALDTFRLNHFTDASTAKDDPRACCDDVQRVNKKRILKAIYPRKRVDVLIGGPSCQGVSPAGLRNPRDKRNQMLLAFVRLVRELRPKWFVMENVPGLTHANNRELLLEILKLLEGIKGYTVAGDVLLAADHGVPQLRYRLFVVGTRTKAPIRFPLPTHHPAAQSETLVDGASKPYATVADAIRTLATIPPIETEPGEAPVAKTGEVQNHWCRSITEVNRKRIAAVRNGHDWRDIPIKLLPERYFTTRSSDQKGSYGRLAWDWPAYTVTNASLNITAGAFTHPDHHRCLSVREVARLQSFPDDYIFRGSIEAQYRQVGNAVPPKLAEAVASTILAVHFGRGRRTMGAPGRLTRTVVKASVKGTAELPTLTPRCPHPDVARSSNRKTPSIPNERPDRIKPAKTRAVWTRSPRPEDPWPKDTKRLRILAAQPKNSRAAKRARSIVQFIDGVRRDRILADANVSVSSVRKWIDSYYAHGPDGWRAYHSGFSHLAPKDAKLQRNIEASVSRARRILLAPVRGGAVKSKRLHMNGYIQQLIGRFGSHSFEELLVKVQERLGAAVGTVYVGDLLGIADAVLSVGPPQRKRDPGAAAA